MADSEVLETIGAEARDRLVEAYQRMTAGPDPLPPGRVSLVLRDMLVQGNTAARIDGEALALRQLEELGIDVDATWTSTGRSRADRRAALRAAGELAEQERARFTSALATILTEATDEESILTRLGRLALAEAIDAARARTADVMRGTELVEGWVRELDSDPCQLCRWWWRDGRVWPASHNMPKHPGCACAQRWTAVPQASIRMVGTEAEAASAARYAAEEGTP